MKNEFLRGAMEKALGLNTMQAELHIKEFLKKGIIKRTKKFEAKTGKGQRQVIYNFHLPEVNYWGITRQIVLIAGFLELRY